MTSSLGQNSIIHRDPKIRFEPCKKMSETLKKGVYFRGSCFFFPLIEKNGDKHFNLSEEIVFAVIKVGY